MVAMDFPLPDELRDAPELPSPPGVVFEILRLMESEDTSAEDLAQVIQLDPALTGKLLRIVNSPLYGVPRSVDSVGRAATLLGFRAVRLLALAFSVTENLPLVDKSTGFDLPDFWTRSLVSAVSGRAIGNNVGRHVADSAFVGGLLCNLGRLVLAHCLPRRYSPLLAQSKWPTPSEERAHLGYTSAAVSAGLLSQWELPAHLCAAVAYQHQPLALPSDSDPEARLTSRIVATAQVISDEAMREGTIDLEKIYATAIELLGIDVRTVEKILLETRDQLDETEPIVSVRLPDGVTASDLMSSARALLSRVLNAKSRRTFARLG